MAFDFMMPPQGGVGELPPGMPPAAVATPVPMMPPPQAMPLPQAQAPDPMAAALPQVMQEEGAQANSPDGMGFFDKLRTDPKMSQAMMMVGLRMMQGQKPGQDAMGMVGDAMMAGAVSHNMLKYNEGEQQRKEAEFGLKKEEAGVRMDSTRASTVRTQQDTDFKAQLQPEELAKAKELVLKYKNENRLDELKLVKEKLVSDPEYVRKMLAADLDVKRGNAAQSYAGAGASNALTADREQDTKLQATLADPKASAEDKALAEKALRKGQTYGGGKLGDLDARAAALLKGGLVKTEQEAYAKAYEDSGDKKGQDFERLKALAQSADPATAKWAEEQMLAGARGKEGKPAGATGTPTAAKVITEAQIASNMTKYGKTREETLAAAKAQGYTLQGAK
jgi:hypothetical protein